MSLLGRVATSAGIPFAQAAIALSRWRESDTEVPVGAVALEALAVLRDNLDGISREAASNAAEAPVPAG